MLNEKEKDLIAIMKEIGAKEEDIIGTFLLLNEVEDEKDANIEKLIKYICSKGKHVTLSDIVEKALQISMPCEQYLPSHMYVKYIGPNTEGLRQGAIYHVFVSYNNDRQFLIEDETGEQEVYDAAQFEIMEIAEIEYTGCEGDSGELEITEGFTVGTRYGVSEIKGGKYQCDNGLACYFYEGDPTKFVVAPPKKKTPFRHSDEALKCVRRALEFGRTAGLENRLDPKCAYISQDTSIELHDASSIITHIKKVGEVQLKENIFLDCALASVSEVDDGCRFPVGTRCMPVYIDGKHSFTVFVDESDGVITGIYIMTERYGFTGMPDG